MHYVLQGSFGFAGFGLVLGSGIYEYVHLAREPSTAPVGGWLVMGRGRRAHDHHTCSARDPSRQTKPPRWQTDTIRAFACSWGCLQRSTAPPNVVRRSDSRAARRPFPRCSERPGFA